MTSPSHPVVDEVLSPELVDLITETVVWADGPTGRADALRQIVACAVEALCWRLEPDGRPQEENSARSVVLAATEHLDRARQLR